MYAFLFDDLPSVTRGPLSMQKAKDTFNFEASDFEQSMQETIHFYNDSYIKFPKMRKSIEKDILYDVLKTDEEKFFFKNFIKQFE
jgi:hypothetical protein